ncbi:hypothetical protein N7497_011523 [Penicillium chrysogenum]|nr:hypothetical protein N7497_011523 [Penicillium chrysogenum]
MPAQPRPDPKGPTDDSDDTIGFIPISLTNDEEDSAPEHTDASLVEIYTDAYHTVYNSPSYHSWKRLHHARDTA